MPSLTRNEAVFVLDLGDGENRLNPDSLDALEGCLDEIEAAPPPRALVTAASGKTWSNGLDLEWLAGTARRRCPSSPASTRCSLAFWN